MADFFAELVGAVGDVSLQLAPDDSVHMMEGMVHPYKGKSTKQDVIELRHQKSYVTAVISEVLKEDESPLDCSL